MARPFDSWRARGLACALLAAGCATGREPVAEPWGSWTLARGAAAPWAPDAAPASGAQGALRGATVRFEPARVAGPAPLGCGNARYELVVTPAEGLFQGSLPAPAEPAARALGVTRLPVLTLQVTCDGGVFDYHLVADGAALTALDGVVWTLERTAPATGPAAAVLALLREHMTGDMGFAPDTVARKRALLTPGLARAIDAYFERPVSEDLVPPIDGDPFTDSQEYPSRFSLGEAASVGAGAVVPVSFRDGARVRGVEFVLRRDGERWLVDDLRYEDGGTLRELLR